MEALLQQLHGKHGNAVSCELRMSRDIGGPLSQLLQQKQEPQHCSSNNNNRVDICLDLLSEGSYCPLSGSLLGAALLKQTQLQQLGLFYCSIRRRQWLRASESEQQQLLLQALKEAVGKKQCAGVAIN